MFSDFKVVSLLARVVEHLVTGETMQMMTSSDQRCRYVALGNIIKMDFV